MNTIYTYNTPIYLTFTASHLPEEYKQYEGITKYYKTTMHEATTKDGFDPGEDWLVFSYEKNGVLSVGCIPKKYFITPPPRHAFQVGQKISQISDKWGHPAFGNTKTVEKITKGDPGTPDLILYSYYIATPSGRKKHWAEDPANHFYCNSKEE